MNKSNSGYSGNNLPNTMKGVAHVKYFYEPKSTETH